MNLRIKLNALSIPILFMVLILLSGCGPSLKLVKNNFYGYDGLSADLENMEKNFNDVVDVVSIGETHEKRSVFAVKLSGKASAVADRPELMAIFTEHGSEHDVTDLAMGIIHYLSSSYGHDDRVTSLLNKVNVWIIPMMNPDGVEYDLSGAVRSFSWRKNRRPTGEGMFGVDLNRNWGYDQNTPIPEELAKDLSNKNSHVYSGEAPFSEKETQAIRDFLLSHSNVEIFIDYHSGSFGFLQGCVFCFSSRPKEREIYPDVNTMCEEIVWNFAKKINNPNDNRAAFAAIEEQNISKTLKEYAPFYIIPFISDSAHPSPGVSGEFVYGQLGIMAIGVEIFRDRSYFNKLSKNKTDLIASQTQGILFLLDALSNKYNIEMH